MERGLAQVEMTYMDNTYNWNMLYRYYALFSRAADFFCIDSSTFLFD